MGNLNPGSKKMAIHTSTYKGKRVYIILKNGASFIDKFVDSKGSLITFKERGKVAIKDIRSFSIWKAK